MNSASKPIRYQKRWYSGHLGKLIFCLLLTILLPNCLNIKNNTQPATAMIGEEITLTLEVEITDKAGDQLVLGFLTPRAWKASENTTVSFESTIGNSNMSLMPKDEVDPENKLPWVEQVRDRVGFGENYGEVEWTMFKADQKFTPPDGTDENNPVTGTVTIKTKVGDSNMITQLGYFLGDALWGYLNDDGNSTFFFAEECIEIIGGNGQAQNLCGPAPRKLVDLETYTFDDLLTITFDAQEDQTALIGASKVFFCSEAVHEFGTDMVCEQSQKTEMRSIGPDLWQLTIWPESFYNIPEGSNIQEILANFQDEFGNTIVRDVSGNDFQILAKCF